MGPVNAFHRIFGSGPVGTVVSLVLLAAAWRLERELPGLALGVPAPLRIAVLAVTSVAAVGVIVWSLRSLPPAARGRDVVDAGIYRWVRHPLYAAFLSLFNFGLAIYLDHLVYVAWALGLHPVWHGLIRFEERLMLETFGDRYAEYARRTGRFLPRFGSGGASPEPG